MRSNPVEAAIVAVLGLLLVFALSGGVPIPSKFNTRTLLTWTTVVAAALGVIAYAAKT